jgi:hypothetical protein
MLWMKAWLETRWRFALVLVLPFFVVARNAGSAQRVPQMLYAMSLFCAIAGVYLAGAGIQTQSSWRTTRGIHGSMIFTLSLPVSRLRLFIVRATTGLLETAAVIAILISSAWAIVPGLRGDSTPSDLLRFAFAAFVSTAGFYSVSLLLATFLEGMWQIYGSLILIVLLSALSERLPSSLNVERIFTTDSPLVTHVLPWPEMAVFLGLALVLTLAAARIVQTREY